MLKHLKNYLTNILLKLRLNNGFLKIYFSFLILILFQSSLQAHEIRPAYLEIRELPGRIQILWKMPVAGEVAVRLNPVLSSGWLKDSSSAYTVTYTSLVRKWNIRTENSIAEQTITIEGLETTITDVLVKITFANGDKLNHLIKPSKPFYKIERIEASTLPIFDYLVLGMEHIFFGIDHLLFILGLILLVKGRWKLIKTITAFTVAHSITLGASALGLVELSPAPVEVVISLSIIFLAVELVHMYQGKPVFTAKYPWLVAFIFGLLHGFGFASALMNIGLPQDDILKTLFLFNAGVENGQLVFVFMILSAGYIINKIFKNIPDWLRWIPPYAIGSLAAYWFIERLGIMFSS